LLPLAVKFCSSQGETTKPKEKQTMTTNAKLEKIKKTAALLNRIADNMTGEDFETQDALRRVLRDLDTDIFELELDAQPATGEELADFMAA
jgi:hypothetical protein